jgi:hypothetical protein
VDCFVCVLGLPCSRFLIAAPVALAAVLLTVASVVEVIVVLWVAPTMSVAVPQIVVEMLRCWSSSRGSRSR